MSSITPDTLQFGTRFRVHLNSGEELLLTFLHRTRGAGGYARRPDGEIIRLEERKVDWTTLESQPTSAAPPPLRPGDFLHLKGPAGSMRAELLEPITGGKATVKLHGQDVPFPLEHLSACHLEFPTTELCAGDSFEVRSNSGKKYKGSVVQFLPDGRLMVKLQGGRTADLRVERLDMNSYRVLLEAPVALLDAPEVGGVDALDDIDIDNLAAADLEEIKAKLNAARSSTARLKKQLLLQEDELGKARTERSELESEVKRKEKALESEVWRGLATHRELSKTRKMLRPESKGTEGE